LKPRSDDRDFGGSDTDMSVASVPNHHDDEATAYALSALPISREA